MRSKAGRPIPWLREFSIIADMIASSFGVRAISITVAITTSLASLALHSQFRFGKGISVQPDLGVRKREACIS